MMRRFSLFTCLAAGLIFSMAATVSLAAPQDSEAPKTEKKPDTGKQGDEKHPRVKMKTSQGDIIIELDAENAPISTANFLEYVDDDFYNGTIFHRVIPTFMIQGGGFTKDLEQKKTRAPIKNEWQNGLKNDRGTIAMARTSAPDSATCQFFINVKDNPALDQPRGGAAYAVFGKVVEGMDVVDKIKDVETRREAKFGMREKAYPVETVEIIDVSRVE